MSTLRKIRETALGDVDVGKQGPLLVVRVPVVCRAGLELVSHNVPVESGGQQTHTPRHHG